jgi:hypothetical protein
MYCIYRNITLAFMDLHKIVNMKLYSDNDSDTDQTNDRPAFWSMRSSHDVKSWKVPKQLRKIIWSWASKKARDQGGMIDNRIQRHLDLFWGKYVYVTFNYDISDYALCISYNRWRNEIKYYRIFTVHELHSPVHVRETCTPQVRYFTDIYILR